MNGETQKNAQVEAVREPQLPEVNGRFREVGTLLSTFRKRFFSSLLRTFAQAPVAFPYRLQIGPRFSLVHLILLFLGSPGVAMAQGSFVFNPGIPNQVVAEDTQTPPIPFAVSGSGAQGTITVIGTSSNLALVPNENILITYFNGAGQLILVPAPNQFGNTTISLTARNSAGSTATSPSFLLTVTPVNDPPTVRLTNPSRGQQFLVPASIFLSAEAVDVDGTVTLVEFFQKTSKGGTQKIGQATASPFTFTWQGVTSGVYELWANATDDKGMAADSIHITNNVVNQLFFQDSVQVFEGDSSSQKDSRRVIPPLQLLSFPVTNKTTLNYITTEGTATLANGDYEFASGTIVLDANQITTKFDAIPNIYIYGNTTYQADREFYLNWSSSDNVSLVTNQFRIKILDDDPPPRLSVSTIDLHVDEGNRGTNIAVLTLSLFPQSGKPVQVGFKTSPELSVEGKDYLPLSDVDGDLVNFKPYDTTAYLVIKNFEQFPFLQGQSQLVRTNLIVDNNIDEPDKTFFIDLLVNTNSAILDPHQSRIRVTILDDDPPPTISINNVSATSSNPGTTNAAIFTVSLSAPSGFPVAVKYATGDNTAHAGADYVATSGILNFVPSEAIKTIFVPVIPQVANQPTKTFSVNLSSPTNASIAIVQGVGTIVSGVPPPTLSVNDVTATALTLVTNTMVFNVTLSQASAQDVTFEYATADITASAGVDYVSNRGLGKILAGQTSQTVTVVVNSQTVNQPTYTFALNLSNLENATPAKVQGIGTILPAIGPPSISVSDVMVTASSASATNANFTLTLSAASGQSVTVGYSTVDDTAKAGTDYVAASGTVTFDPRTTSRTIAVVVKPQTVNEPTKTFTLSLTNAVNAALVSVRPSTGTILPAISPPTITISDVAVVALTDRPLNALFNVSLSAPSSQTISLNYTTVDSTAKAGTDYVRSVGPLTFEPFITSRALIVVINPQPIHQATNIFFVKLTNVTNAPPVNVQATGTILPAVGPPAVSVNDVTVTAPLNGTNAVSFNVGLSAPSGEPVMVDYFTSNNTAKEGADYLAASGTLSFDALVTNKTVSVILNPQTTFQPTNTFFLNLTNAVNATTGDGQGIATILPGVAPPMIQLIDAPPVTEGNSAGATADFKVMLSAPSGLPVSVDFKTSDGTAKESADYVSTFGTLQFQPGEISKTISVPVIADTLHEAEEDFILNLSNPTNARLASVQARAVIIDDDALPAISIADISLPEGNAGSRKAVFTATLSTVSSQTVTVNYTTADGTATGGTDYIVASGTLTFNPGETSQQITVLIQGDSLNEPDETFFVKLANPIGAALTNSQATGTILNDDPVPTLSINDVSIIEGQGSTSMAVFAVSLSTASAQTVSVNFATSDGTAKAGSDYVGQTGTVVFSPGDVIKPIAVPINGDTVFEPDEDFFVTLTHSIRAEISRAQGTGTILNDDLLPSLSISDTAVTEGNSGTTDAVFTVRLSSPSSQLVAVEYSTADGTAIAGIDYVAVTSGKLTFNPGDTNQTITIAVKGDLAPELEKSFFVNLSSAVNAGILDGQGVGTITDNDAPVSISIIDAILTEPNSGTSNMVFTVGLSTPSSGPVTVDYATLDNTAQAGSDYESTSGTLVISPGATTGIISVPIIGDLVNEDEESFFIRLSNNSSNSTLADNRGIGTIIDNDSPPTISISDAAVTEGNSGTANAIFTVSLSSASAKIISVNVAAIEGTAKEGIDFQPTSDVLTFLPGTTSRNFFVPVIGDTEDEPNESFSVLLSNPVNATLGNPRGVGTIIDDDVAASLSISDASVLEGNSGSTTAVFTVRLSSPSSQTVTVDFKTADRTATAGSDYVTTAGTLTFSPGVTTNSVRVPIIADTIKESDETFEVRLSNPLHARLSREVGVGTILDEDVLPTLTVTDATVTEGNSGVANAVFLVRLSNPSAQAVTVGFKTADGTATAGSDYKSTSGTVQFPAGSLSQTISVEVNGDIDFEPDETYFVNLMAPTNAVIARSQGLGTILNDDAASDAPPTVRIIAPATGAAFMTPAELTISADAFDRDGQIRRIDFFVGSTLLGSAVNPPYSLPWKNDAVGEYSLTVRATDDRGNEAVSEPVKILVTRNVSGAEVAIIRNFPDPEITLLQTYLLEMGISSQVFEQEGLSFDAVRDAHLVIWDDLGATAQGLTDREVGIFRQAFDAEIPIYFIGASLASSTSSLTPALQNQWMNLIRLGPSAANRSDGTVVPNDVVEPPVISGRFGQVGRFNCSPNIEGKFQSGPGVTLLGKSGNADLIVAYEDPAGDRQIRTVTQNFGVITAAGAAAITEQEKLFKNAVAWLTRKTFEALTDLSATIEGPSDPVPAGREFTYSIAIQHQGEIEGTGAAVTILLPSGVRLIRSEFVQGSLTETNGVVTYALGNMASAQRATLSLVLSATTGGKLTTRVNVVGNEPDPNPGNNSTSIETLITGSSASSPALKVVRSDSQGVQLSVTGALVGNFRVQVSADLSHWSELTNFTGRSTAVLVTDPLASSLKYRFYRVISP